MVHLLHFLKFFYTYYDIKGMKRNKFRPDPEAKLMDQITEVLRYHHYAFRTETTYCQWILRYLHFHGGKTHPKYLGAHHVERYLSHLATQRKVSASTQRQALNAIVFLYREVLNISLAEKNCARPRETLCDSAHCFNSERGTRFAGKNDRNPSVDGKTSIRRGLATDGMYSPAYPRH